MKTAAANNSRFDDCEITISQLSQEGLQSKIMPKVIDNPKNRGY